MDQMTYAGTLTSARAYAVLPAEDLERARAFYRDVLGLSIEDAPEGGMFMARAGSGTEVMIYERGRATAENTALTFEVDDIAQTMDELRSRGVEFEEYDQPGLKTENGVARMGDGFAAWFIDTEGNIINVSEPRL